MIKPPLISEVPAALQCGHLGPEKLGLLATVKPISPLESLGICQPWINKPLGRLIGGVPFKYWIMTIGGVPPLINKPLFINPGLTLYVG